MKVENRYWSFYWTKAGDKLRNLESGNGGWPSNAELDFQDLFQDNSGVWGFLLNQIRHDVYWAGKKT